MKGLILFLLVCVLVSSLNSCEFINVPLKWYSLEKHAGVLLRILYPEMPFPFVCDDFVVISERSDTRVFPLKEIQNSCVILVSNVQELTVQYSHTFTNDDSWCVLYESEIISIPLDSGKGDLPSVILSSYKEETSDLFILSVLLPYKPSVSLTEDLFATSTCSLVPLSNSGLVYKFIIRFQSTSCNISLPNTSLFLLGFSPAKVNQLTVYAKSNNIITSSLICTQQQSFAMQSYISCIATFSKPISYFNVNHLVLIHGTVVTFTIMNDVNSSQVFIYIQMEKDQTELIVGLLYGAASDDDGNRSDEVEAQTISVYNRPFSVTVLDRSSPQPCVDGYYSVLVKAASPLPGLSLNSISLKGSSLIDTERVDAYSFLLRITARDAVDVSVKILRDTLFDNYFNTNEESNELKLSNDCTKPVISLPFDTLHTSNTIVSFDFNVTGSILSYTSSIRTSSGRYCTIYRRASPGFLFYCAISSESTVRVTLDTGSFTSDEGMTNDMVIFFIIHTSKPLNATLSWRSLSQIPLWLRVTFTQDMDWDTIHIQNWLQLTNAIVDSTKYYSESEVDVLIVPKQWGDLHVVLVNQINGTPIKSRYGNQLESSVMISTLTDFSVVYTHLVTLCSSNCQAPLPVYLYLSEPTNFTSDALSVSNGEVLSYTLLSTLPSFSSDVSLDESFSTYLIYIKPSNSHITDVSVVLPVDVLYSNRGLRNAQSNHIKVDFVLDEDGVSCLSSPYTNLNPYEVIVQYPYAISGVVAAKAIETTRCKVVDTSLVGADRLRVVLEIDSEGEGWMTIPAGLSLSLNGVISEKFMWHFLYDITPPQADISCDAQGMSNEDVRCQISLSEVVTGSIDGCIEMDDNGIIVSFTRISSVLYEMYVNGNHDGNIVFFVRDQCFQDSSGNFNIRSNSFTLKKDTVVIYPEFTTVYVPSRFSNPSMNITASSSDAYFIQIIITFNHPVTLAHWDRIHVSHGSIHDVSQQVSLWLFYVCPYHQGLIEIWSDEGAFEDSSGRLSKPSNLLEFNVIYEVTHCHFVTLSTVNDVFVIQVDVLCERTLVVDESSFSISNATLLSLNQHSDFANPPLNHSVLILKPQAAEVKITVDFTPAFTQSYHIVAPPLVIDYSAVPPNITAKDLNPDDYEVHVFEVVCDTECTNWPHLTAVFSQSGTSLMVYPYDGVWKDKANSMKVVVDVKPNQAGTIFFTGLRNSRGVEGVWKGSLLPLSGVQDQDRNVFIGIQRLNDDLVFRLITSNFTNYRNHKLRIIYRISQAELCTLDPVSSSDTRSSTVYYSGSLGPGSYKARFVYCTFSGCVNPWDRRYSTELDFDVLNDMNCLLMGEPYFVSDFVPVVVTLSCSIPVSLVNSRWVSVPEGTLVNLGPINSQQWQILVLSRYGEAQEVSVLEGTLMGYGYQHILSVAPLVLNYTTTRVKPEFGRVSWMNYIAEMDLYFPTAMNFSSITKDALLVRDGDLMFHSVDVKSSDVLHLKLTFVTYSSVYITFKAGVCSSLNRNEPNLASSTIEVSYTENLFSLQSSMENIQEITENQLKLELTAVSILVAIHSSDFLLDNCLIDTYSTATIEGTTHVYITLHLLEPGEFSIRLPKRIVQAYSGEFNAEWEFAAEYVESEVGTEVVMNDLLRRSHVNIPLLVEIRFSKKVDSLNATCFELENINNLNIVGFNPYFVVHAFPKDDGPCSIQLKPDCVHTLMKGESFPATDRLTAVFDVHAPTLNFPLNNRVFLTSHIFQIVEFSEPTNAMSVYGLVDMDHSTLYSVVDVSPLIHILIIDLDGTPDEGSFAFPQGLIEDDAMNVLIGKPTLRYSLGSDGLFSFTAVQPESMAAPLSFRLRSEMNTNFTLRSKLVEGDSFTFDPYCWLLDVTRTEISVQMVVFTSAFSLSVYPPRPGFVLCEVQVSEQSTGRSVGSLTAVARLIPQELNVHLEVMNPMTNNLQDGLMDRYPVVRMTTDQALDKCSRHFLILPSCKLKHVAKYFSHPFETICDYELECPDSGTQMVMVNRYAIRSVGGASNPQEVVMEVPYEKSRPSVTLLDVTDSMYITNLAKKVSRGKSGSGESGGESSEGSGDNNGDNNGESSGGHSGKNDDDPPAVLTYQRSLMAVFSHNVTTLLITAIVCENCLVLRMQRLNGRIVLFDVVPSRNVVPYVTMRCLIPENSVMDASGTFNARSTPFTLSIPTGSLILFFSTMPPITHNSTLIFHLVTSEPFTHFVKEDLTVRNGYVISLDNVAHPIADASSLFMYDIMVKATAEGSVCVELPKGTVTTHISHTHNPEAVSACCSYDSLIPYLVSSSPTVLHLPHSTVWVTFEFSESLLLLYNPSLSFTENLELFTVERLLSAVCAPGLTGECISIDNAEVLEAAVASNRIAFLLSATSDGVVSIHIPRAIFTDWAGNGLKENITKILHFNTKPLHVQSAQMIVFSRGSFKPEVLLYFSVDVEMVENVTQSICSYNSVNKRQYCVPSQDVKIKGNSVRAEIDTVFESPNSYSIEIPSGFFHDEYWNYFEGSKDNTLCLSSYVLRLINVSHTANQVWVIFAVFFFVLGAFMIIAGYKNIYYCVLSANAALLFCLLVFTELFFLSPWIQNLGYLWIAIGTAATIGASLFLSYGVFRLHQRISLHLFCATIGCVVGVALDRIATDIQLLLVGYITTSVFLPLFLLPLVCAVIATSVPMVHRWQYLLGIAVVGVSLVIEALFLVVIENVMDIYLLGRSCSLLVDLIEIVAVLCGVAAVYDVQKKINTSERYHEYYFGKRTKRCVGREKNGKSSARKRRKSKKEEKSRSLLKERKGDREEEGGREEEVESCITNV